MSNPKVPCPEGAAPSMPAPVTVIRSEERSRTSTTAAPRSRLRIQKVIVTEERTITVQVRHEELRITEIAADTEPDDHAADAASPATHHDDDFDLVLSAEQLDIRTTVVPVERVHFTRSRVTTPTNITVQLDQEEVSIDPA